MSTHPGGGARGAGRAAASFARACVAALVLVAVAACGALGGDAPARVWYQLEDQRPAERSPGAALPRTLLVEAVSASAVYDSSALVFSRAPGALAPYQYAAWADRPARRIGMLVEQRLVASGRFATVAQSTAGVRGDLMLRLSLDEFVHDAAAPPGRVRVALRADLIDWNGRTQVARRAFTASEPVATEDAAAAVAGFNRAVTRLLDELAPWVEAAAAGR
jgi:cholesterol transport system auxiliary component